MAASLPPSLSDIVDETYDDSEDAETMTAAQVLAKLEEAWLNEKLSPELLPHHSEIVDCMMEQLSVMQQNINRARKTDLKVSIHKMEIDRIRYVLSSYLRERLKKIELFAEHILEMEKHTGTQLLTDEERTFATTYQSKVMNHFNLLALRHMPANVQNLDPKKTASSPNVDAYVFVKIINDVAGIVIEEDAGDAGEEVIDVHTGDQHIMRYKPIAALVSSGDAVLI